jgi:hypothetical protein
MTIGDDALMTLLLSGAEGTSEALGDRTASLVRLAALIFADAETPAHQREVRNAIIAGASLEQINGVLLAIARLAGPPW